MNRDLFFYRISMCAIFGFFVGFLFFSTFLIFNRIAHFSFLFSCGIAIIDVSILVFYVLAFNLPPSYYGEF